MRRTVYGVLLVLAAFAVPNAQPDEKLSVAVNSLQGKGVSTHEAEVISDRLRSELVSTGVFRVMERGEMDAILKEQGFQQSGACDDAACLVEVGQLLGVKRILAGAVGKVGETYTISARMIDVGSGEVVSVANVDVRGSIDLVLTKAAGDIARKLASDVRPAQTTPAGAAAPAATPVPKAESAKKAVAPKPAKAPKVGSQRSLRPFGMGLSVGAALPLGSLASDDIDGGGYAEAGVGVAMDMAIRFGKAPLGARVHVGYQRNGVDETTMESDLEDVAYEELYNNAVYNLEPDVTVRTGPWQTVPFLFGLRLQTPGPVGFCADILAGVCLTIQPRQSVDMEFVDIYTYETTYADSWSSPPKLVADFGLSPLVGVVFVRRFELGVRLMYWAPGDNYLTLRPCLTVWF